MENRAPLFEQLLIHYQSDPISLHVPGHKMGQGFNPLGQEIFHSILKIDMTEINGLDDLHQPEGIIQEAEQRAAKLFQADYTFFLVNGSTVGNLAMVLSVCNPGDKIIVQRNVHKSVIHAMILARVKPIYVIPEMILELGIPGSVSFHHIKEALNKHPDAKAVFLMNPNYYGIGIDITDMVGYIHQYNIPVLIDEAHGAHFGFHSAFPLSSLQMGADMVVQSTHKTLSAMTMGSMLHVKDRLIDVERVRLFLSMLQSSSPSYPIMASLDLARHWIEKEKEALWEKALDLVEWLHDETEGFSILQLNHSLNERYYIDPLKITIHSLYSQITGFYIQKQLEAEGLYTELSDLTNTLAVITMGTKKEDIIRLIKGLRNMEKNAKQLLQLKSITKKKTIKEDQIDYEYLFKGKESIISLEGILYKKKKTVSIKDAINHVSAEMVIPYPPGVPIIQLGERITKDAVEYIVELKRNGARFQGVTDTNLETIKIVDLDRE